MIRIIIIAIVVVFIAAYFIAPDSLKPWMEASSHAGEITANAVRSAGNAVNQATRDEAHKDSIIDKTKDSVSDAAIGK